MNTAPTKMLMNVYVMNSQTLTQGHDDIERDLKPCTETEIGLGMDDWTLRPLWLLTLKSKFCCAWPFNDVPADIWKKRAGTTPMKGVPIGVRTKICTFRVPPPAFAKGHDDSWVTSESCTGARLTLRARLYDTNFTLSWSSVRIFNTPQLLHGHLLTSEGSRNSTNEASCAVARQRLYKLALPLSTAHDEKHRFLVWIL